MSRRPIEFLTYPEGDTAAAWASLWAGLAEDGKMAFLPARECIPRALEAIQAKLQLPGADHGGYGGVRLLNLDMANKLGDWLMGYFADEAEAHGVGYEVRVYGRRLGWKIWFPRKDGA